MKAIALYALTTLTSLVSASSAFADIPLTRDQVRAETISAARNGEIPSSADVERAPAGHAFKSTRSRAEVRAEAVEALREPGSHYRRNADLHHFMQTEAAGSRLTRAQVIGELKEASRLGLIGQGDSQQKIATPTQLEQIRQAGLRAAMKSM